MPVRAAVPWVAPFVLFMVLLAALKPLGIPQPWNAALWIVLLVAVLPMFYYVRVTSRGDISS